METRFLLRKRSSGAPLKLAATKASSETFQNEMLRNVRRESSNWFLPTADN